MWISSPPSMPAALHGSVHAPLAALASLLSFVHPGDGAPHAAGGELVERIAALAEPWKSLYSDHAAVSATVMFLHLAALVVGGGLAIAADRATLRAWRGDAVARARQLGELGLTHRPVLVALAVVFASGALLFLADVETFATSPVFWVKMGLVALLLANGAVMTRAEQSLRRDEATAHGALWGRLRVHALLSVGLWLATLFAGTVLAGS